MIKISNLSSPDSFFQAQHAPKSVFGQPRTPLGELTTPLLGWGGDTSSPFPSPLDAFGVSVLRPPSTQNPGYASAMGQFLPECSCCMGVAAYGWRSTYVVQALLTVIAFN